MDEISAKFNKVGRLVVETTFNGMRIQYITKKGVNITESDHDVIYKVRKCLQTAIAMASKTWQLQELMAQGIHYTNGKPCGDVIVETIK